MKVEIRWIGRFPYFPCSTLPSTSSSSPSSTLPPPCMSPPYPPLMVSDSADQLILPKVMIILTQAGQLVLFAPKPLQKMEEQRVREVQRINSQVNATALIVSALLLYFCHLFNIIVHSFSFLTNSWLSYCAWCSFAKPSAIRQNDYLKNFQISLENPPHLYFVNHTLIFSKTPKIHWPKSEI